MDQTLFNIMHASLGVRQQEIHQALYKAFDGKVQSGPFAGMSILPQGSWGSGDIGPKIIGCYEQELHPFLAGAYDTVVNVGCAEGYYAVGMARLLPNVEVFAFDTDERAQTICRQNAEVNGISDRVTIWGACTAIGLQIPTDRPGKKLVIFDCEGGEKVFIDTKLVPGLAECDLIIECHDFLDRSITTTLIERLTPTHDIQRVVEGERDPNIPALQHWHSIDRWLAISEGRPETMWWLVCRPKPPS